MRGFSLSINGSKSVDITGVRDVDTGWVASLLDAVRGLRFGAVELLVHDGRVVQIERREKLRFEPDRTRRPEHRERNQDDHDRTDRPSGGADAKDQGDR